MLTMLLAFPDARPFEIERCVASVESRVRYREPGALEFEGLCRVVKPAEEPEPARVLFKGRDLPWRNASLLSQGSVFSAKVRCKEVEGKGGPFSYDLNLYRKGISHVCSLLQVSEVLSRKRSSSDRMREYSVEKVESVAGKSENSGLLLSMLIGEPDTLGERAESAFKRTGLAHLLVVSGYQVTLLFYLVYELLWRLLMLNKRIACDLPVRGLCFAGGLALAFGYGCLTGLEMSVIRALVAVTILMATRALERKDSFLHLISLTLLALSFWWPGIYLEPGTQLTFAALTGIWLGSGADGSLAIQYIRVTTFASMLTAIVTMWWFGNLSPLTLVMNPLFATPVSIFACKAGIISIVLNCIGLDKGGLAILGLVWCLDKFKQAVEWSSDLPIPVFEPAFAGKLLCTLVAVLLMALSCRPQIRRYLEENRLCSSKHEDQNYSDSEENSAYGQA